MFKVKWELYYLGVRGIQWCAAWPGVNRNCWGCTISQAGYWKLCTGGYSYGRVVGVTAFL